MTLLHIISTVTVSGLDCALRQLFIVLPPLINLRENNGEDSEYD